MPLRMITSPSLHAMWRSPLVAGNKLDGRVDYQPGHKAVKSVAGEGWHSPCMCSIAITRRAP